MRYRSRPVRDVLATARTSIVLLVALLCLSLPALAQNPFVVVESVTLVDNGDGDGYADTYETVELTLRLRNKSGVDLTGVEVGLHTTSNLIGCMRRSQVHLGSLDDGAIGVPAQPFVFIVANVDRTALGLSDLDDFSAEFTFSVTSDQLTLEVRPAKIVLDLDLDVVGGSGPTAFHESFESGTLGSFTNQNLDKGLHGLAASDGYRCQYHDPDNPDSNSHGEVDDCYLGATATQADAVFWQVDGPSNPDSVAVDGGRAYEGTHSLYYGVMLDAARGHTTPLAVLEAVHTSQPINLGWDRVCSITRTTSCFDDPDCPGGEVCEDVRPVLSFKHQISLIDERSAGNWPYATDRGVAMAQLADEAGAAAGHWVRLEPHWNVHDRWGERLMTNCTFDPVDDGSTEDDLFTEYGEQPLGPSSTCYPEYSFAWLGDTDAPFNAANVGRASDGPGLVGSSGTGTWVESRFDLSRFRGRRIRLRFLTTAIKATNFETTEQMFQWNPSEVDDGWWIDDLRVSDTLTGAASVFVDPRSNHLLPGVDDGDGDGWISACDNCPAGGNPGQEDVDRDEVGDLCDNCPATSNPDQADADSDGTGDLCDRCPVGDLTDLDSDGYPCVADNCPNTYNPDQSLDADGDFFGDVCDVCPFDSANDADGDAWCADMDNCATGFNPDQSDAVRLFEVDLPGGDVESYDFTPDGTAIIAIGDLDEDERGEVYRVPLRGGAPVPLNGPLVPGGDVTSFAISPDGSWVVYRADQDADQQFELYSVQLSDGSVRKLNGELVTAGDVYDRLGSFQISSNSARVVYHADQDTNNVYELYSVPIGGGAVTKLNGALPVGGQVPHYVAPKISADAARVVYIADQDVDGVFELYSVPITGGAPTKLNGTLPTGGDVGPSDHSFAISPDGSTVVYTAEQDLDGRLDLYSVPITGGASIRLNGTMAPEGDVGYLFEIAPNGGWVVFVADKDVNDVYELYSAPIAGGGTFKLNAPITSSDLLEGPSFWISPDSQWVVYLLDQDTLGVDELYSVRITGSLRTKLNPSLAPGGYVRCCSRITSDSATVVFPADVGAGGAVDLYSVPLTGGTAVQLNDPLVSGGNVSTQDVTPDGATVVYLADQDTDEMNEVYRVSATGGPVTKLSGAMTSGGSALPYLLSPDGSTVVYRADQTTGGIQELYAVQLDPDADSDGALELCDTCPGLADPLQVDGDSDGAGVACECDDADPLRYPGSPELCDGIDNDCDLSVPADEGDDDGDLFVECDGWTGGGGILGGGDCADGDSATHPGAVEINDGLDNQCPGEIGHGVADEISGTCGFLDAGDKQRFSWPAQGGATSYEAARSSLVDFSGACVKTTTGDTHWDDAATPGMGECFHYLVRALAPNAGSWGQDSGGAERSGVCP